MTNKIKTGLAFHCHHDILCEFVYDYDERVQFIKENKPSDEQELRLKLFQFIPDDLIPGRDSPEYKAFTTAGETYVKARKAYYKAWEKEILELHEKLCPDCPWDGKTIFG